MHFEEVKQQEQSYLMPTYGRFQTALVSGKGATAVDTEGRAYIDFGAGIGVNALGYCDPDWVEAVSGQAATLQHISNLYYSPVMTQLAEVLCQLTGFSKVFFGNSGGGQRVCHQACTQIWHPNAWKGLQPDCYFASFFPRPNGHNIVGYGTGWFPSLFYSFYRGVFLRRSKHGEHQGACG